jgi:hypothetical protein
MHQQIELSGWEDRTRDNVAWAMDRLLQGGCGGEVGAGLVFAMGWVLFRWTPPRRWRTRTTDSVCEKKEETDVPIQARAD